MSEKETLPLLDYIAVDVETTGLSPRTDKIIELGMVKVSGGQVVDTYSRFFPPGQGLSKRITELTGITDADLADAPQIGRAWGEIRDFLGDAVLLGHNLSFDYAFLKKVAVDSKENFEREGLDTLRMARRFLTALESRSLGTLCSYYQIPLQAHRACHDAFATHQLYQRLLADFFAQEETCFLPHRLSFGVKRDTPATPRQLSYLRDLAVRNGLRLEGDVFYPAHPAHPESLLLSHLGKSEASRLIDHLRTLR